MSESVYKIREQGSGEPRDLPSPLIERYTCGLIEPHALSVGRAEGSLC